ncbi:hypothetical protein [Micromonospora sp. WMMD737]|uniref:hypothetical protein n=1 Tax=Micromonospora sp. WMMD737 TaxID=3404113 RepID=UPI003B95710A
MTRPSTPPYGRFWPLPDGGNWEGGIVDSDGNRWIHVPWEGWRLDRPSVFLTSAQRPPVPRPSPRVHFNVPAETLRALAAELRSLPPPPRSRLASALHALFTAAAGVRVPPWRHKGRWWWL